MNTYDNPVTVAEENATAPSAAEKEPDYVVRFKKPYMFEGKEYVQIDLSGLEQMSSQDFFEANRIMAMEYISPKPEADAKFCCIMAAVACKVPPEFFDRLPVKEGMKVRNAVQNFFLSTD